MADIWEIRVTFAKKDQAMQAAKALLESRLAACVNIHAGLTSLYHWEGCLQQEAEILLSAKTHKRKLAKAMALIKKLHPYQLPAITAHPIVKGHAPYLKWVAGEVDEK